MDLVERLCGEVSEIKVILGDTDVKILPFTGEGAGEVVIECDLEDYPEDDFQISYSAGVLEIRERYLGRIDFRISADPRRMSPRILLKLSGEPGEIEIFTRGIVDTTEVP